MYIGTYIPVDTKATHINVKCSATVSKSNDDYQETDVGMLLAIFYPIGKIGDLD